MRAVIFCCEVVTKNGVSIFPYSKASVNRWQKRYERHRIKGIATYVNGRFIHFLEGSNLGINNALYTAFFDPSYNHFDCCLNVPASARSFGDWRMVCPSKLRCDHSFERFIDTYRDSIDAPRDTHRAISNLGRKNKKIEILMN